MVRRVLWQPKNQAQEDFIRCDLEEVFLGGARGGGKTDGVLGKWLIEQEKWGPEFNAVAFRKKQVAFEDAWERARRLYLPIGANMVTSPKYRVTFPKGGRIEFGHLDSLDDADAIQGRNITRAWIEEMGQYETPKVIFRLYGALRSASGMPVQLVGTGNPGGPGQHWIAKRYQLIPFPRSIQYLEVPIDPEDPEAGTHRVAVIPSRVTDNPFLGEDYIKRLRLVGSKALVDAWLHGDWSAVEGAFFDKWDHEKHVIEPFEIPEHWARFRSIDWGFAAPFSVGWWAIVPDDYFIADGVYLPRGALVRYREWYGANPATGAGLRMDAEEVAEGIKEREEDGENIKYTVVDPAMAGSQSGPSPMERMGNHGILCMPGDNTRLGRRGAMGGWDQVRSRLRGEHGRPMLYCFSTCRDSIRTIPVLQHDQSKIEDVDTLSEDHAADEWRYACMSRPWIPSDFKGSKDVETALGNKHRDIMRKMAALRAEREQQLKRYRG